MALAGSWESREGSARGAALFQGSGGNGVLLVAADVERGDSVGDSYNDDGVDDDTGVDTERASRTDISGSP